MAQLHFTLDSDFFVGLFSETKDEAFGKLMEALLNQVLQAESTEQKRNPDKVINYSHRKD